MQRAIVENDVIVNIVEASDGFSVGINCPPGASIGWVRVDGVWGPPMPAPYNRAAAGVQIDEAVAAIYSRFTRFQLEYTEREAQAQAFKDAGYTGPVPLRVAEFATPAGMPAQAATDLILQQAVNLRAAQGELSALRMRKYEVLRAATDEQAQSAALEILAAIEAIGRTVQ